VQKNEQPSWTLTKARVRSTDARPSAIPSISTPDRVGSARSTEHRVELREEPVLGPVVDQPSVGIDRGERLPADLDRTAGDEDLGIRAGATGTPHGMPGLRVRLGRDGAGVDEDEVRRSVAVDHGDPAIAEPSRRDLHLGPVHLAAEVGDRRGPDRTGDGRRRGARGHHSSGFVLIRKPIVPTIAAIP
jgi:hypothetical protein